MYDVAIVGGGPAGLSAALILGRCCRRVLLCDHGQPRNAAAAAMHGFLSRDGLPPEELLRLGRDELSRYGVELRPEEVVAAESIASPRTGSCSPAFRLSLASGETLESRKLLLATGVRDILPEIEGLRELYGASVHHCPYCDGWEHRDQRLVAFGAADAAPGLAMSLRTWSEHITACTDGESLSASDRDRLRRNGVAWREQRISRLVGEGSALHRIEFHGGSALECDALFFNTGRVQCSPLAERLGCKTDDEEVVQTHGKQRTSVPGLFLAGDADGDVQFVIIAAGEGARAAVAINRELQDEDRGEADLD